MMKIVVVFDNVLGVTVIVVVFDNVLGVTVKEMG
jgi:hypothetical protein